ncbi:MAG: bifunctional DNA primase/polymerase, partial [Armatimonadetes bacterium]|nr:bifunctional DNA primase/polymerase [Armatimonadota bacterium]
MVSRCILISPIRDWTKRISVALSPFPMQPRTLTATTARGIHLYYKHPGGQIKNSMPWGKGIDVRADRGYVIAPPSVHESGKTYRWANDATIQPLPPKVEALLRNPPQKRVGVPAKAKRKKAGVSLTVLEGGRNNELASHLGKLRQQGYSEARLSEAAFEFNRAHFSPPLEADEVLAVVASIAKYPVGFMSTDDAIDALNESHAIVLIGGKALVLRETDQGFLLLRPNEFRVLVANRFCSTANGLKCVADVWIAHPRRREYAAVVFEPGGTTTENAYNLWRGWAVTPAPGNYSLFAEHLLNNICSGDEAIYRYVMAWFANIFQQPRNKPGTALVIRGERGTGKSIVGKLVGELLGTSYITVASSRHVIGHFNAHLLTALLI